MRADVRAYDAAKLRLERGADEIIPFSIIERRLSGESAVKVWREYRGITQADLARASGVSMAVIAAIEAGDKWGGVTPLNKLAAVLNLSLENLS